MLAKIFQFESRLCAAHDMRRRWFSRSGGRTQKTRLLSFTIGAVLAGCATPNNELPYYEPPSSGGASVQLASIEGTVQLLQDVDHRTPDRAFCAYALAVDGQIVGLRSNCTAAIPISPGKHTIVARVDGYLLDSPARLGRAITTLTFDAAEGHRYKISVARAGVFSLGIRADVWISDETTQTPVTEARLVNSPRGRLSDDPPPIDVLRSF